MMMHTKYVVVVVVVVVVASVVVAVVTINPGEGRLTAREPFITKHVIVKLWQ